LLKIGRQIKNFKQLELNKPTKAPAVAAARGSIIRIRDGTTTSRHGSVTGVSSNGLSLPRKNINKMVVN